ncbi:DUF5954 family protein, partial [Streptomyces sp. NPDC057557]|uniref:DUF5954 family protein n=1 Tax=Streptomyces sp. NPDC057557 TaxID=3346167 RepID=UPI0036D1AC9A
SLHQPGRARGGRARALTGPWPEGVPAADRGGRRAEGRRVRTGGGRIHEQVRPHEPEVRGRCFQIVRVERMMRIGPVGPKGPRRSDIDVQEPTRIHPAMDAVDEWGNVNSNERRWTRGNS